MKRKSCKGFTLVELVVVIAIIGVLSAILVPSMLNYVKKSRLKSANTNAKTAYNAVADFVTEQEVAGIPRSEIIQYYENKVIDCTIQPSGTGKNAEAQKAVFEMLAENGINAGKVYVGSATINGEADSFYVQWTGDQDPVAAPSDTVFGQYPNAVTWKAYKSNDASWCSYFGGE